MPYTGCIRKSKRLFQRQIPDLASSNPCFLHFYSAFSHDLGLTDCNSLRPRCPSVTIAISIVAPMRPALPSSRECTPNENRLAADTMHLTSSANFTVPSCHQPVQAASPFATSKRTRVLPATIGFRPAFASLLLAQYKRAHQRHRRIYCRIGTDHGPCPEPGDHGFPVVRWDTNALSAQRLARASIRRNNAHRPLNRLRLSRRPARSALYRADSPAAYRRNAAESRSWPC